MPDDVIPSASPADDPNTGVTPAEQREVVEPKGVAPKDQRPGIASLFAETKAEVGIEDGTIDAPDADAEKTPPKVTPVAPAAPSAEDLAKLEGKTPEDLEKLAAASAEDLEAITAAVAKDAAAPDDAEKAKVELDAKLAEFTDPEILNAALEAAGVDKIADLPAVKALIGRMTQSVRDSTKAEIAKAQQEAAQLAEVTAEGRAAKGRVIAALEKLATDIEAGEEGVDIAIPTAKAIEEAFEEYAGSAVGEYHTKAWNVLSDTLYSLPEMGGTVPEGVKTQPPAFSVEQNALLDSVKGANPDVWLAAHLAVERDVLWTWAQQEAAAAGGVNFDNEKKVIAAAHSKDIKTLTKAHEAAIVTAREEARAEALADIASGKTPPKTPVKSTTPKTNDADESDGIPAGASIAEIRRIVKAKTETGVEV